MQVCDIAQLRLQNMGLGSSPFGSPVEVVAHLGAVQAQDFAASKWAIGSRMQTATDEMVESSFNEGKFLRTHIMRPTWHFVMPEDIRWIQELTAPHVKRILATYDKRLNINDEMISRSQIAIGEALQGRNYLTRTELADQLEKSNIFARGQRLAHIVYHAELNALICSGPRRGKKFTYALLEEAVPKAKKLSREKALAQLALKYFSSHGPAQVADFAWWSGLSTKDANDAVNLNKPQLTGIISEGKTYWFSHTTKAMEQKSIKAHDSTAQAFLLSIYDEYTIAYKDRTDISDSRDVERMISMGNALTSVIILNGKVAGSWKRVLKKDKVEIKLKPFKKLGRNETEAIRKDAERYGAFLNKEVVTVDG